MIGIARAASRQKEATVIAQMVCEKVKQMMKRNPDAWAKEIPQECVVTSGDGSPMNVDYTALTNLVSTGLLRSLRRRPTRRTQIYAQFFKHYTDREIRKALGRRGGIAPDTLEFEALEYSRQLALYMTRKAATKLSQKVRSALFTDASDADKFFSDDPLPAAVRAAAPVKNSGGFLTFIHKTVQEHLVADALADGILDAIRSTMLPPAKLLEAVSECVLSDHKGVGSASNRQRLRTIQNFVEELSSSPLRILLWRLNLPL